MSVLPYSIILPHIVTPASPKGRTYSIVSSRYGSSLPLQSIIKMKNEHTFISAHSSAPFSFSLFYYVFVPISLQTGELAAKQEILLFTCRLYSCSFLLKNSVKNISKAQYGKVNTSFKTIYNDSWFCGQLQQYMTSNYLVEWCWSLISNLVVIKKRNCIIIFQSKNAV